MISSLVEDMTSSWKYASDIAQSCIVYGGLVSTNTSFNFSSIYFFALHIQSLGIHSSFGVANNYMTP